jgi:NAD(P)-dependent dehydrogenase (short-subunit alcohol dehydrogenase family)
VSEGPLDGRIAIVTGSLGLLGREHLRALGTAGASLVVTDVDGAACERLATELGAMTGRPAIGIGADITKRDDLARLRNAVTKRFGRIDVLVNNAAIDDKVRGGGATGQDALEASRFESFPLELWQRSLEVNVTGVFLACQVLGTPMAEAGRGSIVNVASTYGLVAPDQSLYRRPDGAQAFFKGPAYPTTKGALLQFTRYLASYWGRAGVRVNALCPGGVENAQDDWFIEAYARRTMLGRMAQRTDYHGAVVFLASDASAYVTGATLVVDGGFTAW